MRFTVVLLAILTATTASAGAIYKHVDANGKVVFSDQPPEGSGAEEVVLPPINKVPGSKGGPAPAAPDNQPVFPGYQALVISGITDGEVMRDPQAPVTVGAMSTPNLQPGHHIVLLHNGTNTGTSAITLPDIARGTHTFVAEIVDDAGAVLFRGQPSSITVHRTIIKRPAGN